MLVAAGAGVRLGSGVPKAFTPLAGRALVVLAVERVLASGVVSPRHLVVVVPAARVHETQALLAALASGAPPPTIVVGGLTRQESVRAGLAALRPEGGVDVVLVHDAARCLAPADLVARVAGAVRSGHQCVVPAVPVHDTVRAVDAAGVAGAVVDRDLLRAVQTPQGFDRGLLERAHAAASADESGFGATDDATLAERLGARIHLVPGSPEAFKVTRPVDLLLAAAVLDAEGSLR